VAGRVETGSESQRIRLVAAANEHAEYDVFVEAWRFWNGEEPPPDRVYADFAEYLHSQTIPAYVRHYVRQWLRDHPHLRRRRAADRRAAWIARGLVLALLVFAVIVALLIRSRY